MSFIFYTYQIKPYKCTLTEEQKESIIYDYEVPKEYVIEDIVSENELLVTNKTRSFFGIYNLDTKKLKHIDNNKDFGLYAEAFDNGIVGNEECDKFLYTYSKKKK